MGGGGDIYTVHTMVSQRISFFSFSFYLFIYLFCFIFEDFIYLFDRERQSAREGTQAGGVGEEEALLGARCRA